MTARDTEPDAVPVIVPPPGVLVTFTDQMPPPWIDFDEPPPPKPLPPDPLGPGVLADYRPLRTSDDEPSDSSRLEPGPPQIPSEWMAMMAPGVGLAVELEGIDPAQTDEYELVEMIAGYHRLAAWAQSRMTTLTGHLSRRPALNPHSPVPADEATLNVTAEEIAPRLGISRFAARRMVDASRAFRMTLEDTAVALQQGHIDYPKACVLLRLLADQPDDVAWEVQQLVLPGAAHQTITQLEREITRAIIAIDPHRATARARKARAARRVDHPRPLPDGMASWYAILPATDAAGLDLALEAAARSAKAAGDTRTIDQLRADALALLGHSALDHGFIGVPEDLEAPTESGATGMPGAPADVCSPAAAPPETATSGFMSEPQVSEPPGAPQPDDSSNPRLETGNSFLRTPRMPIGTIGGRRAEIHVTIPLSVLLPPELLRHPDDPVAEVSRDSSVHSQHLPPDDTGPPQHPPPDLTGPPDARSANSALGEDEDDAPVDDLPPDWYPGPTPAEVAELDGYGPITPDVAHALAYSSEHWRRLITDPLSGTLLDVGRTRYRPPAGMAEFVQLRDRTCVSPTCSTPARSCQLDHVVPWSEGGSTSAANLGPSCTRDHPVKTSGAFELEHLGGGTFVWTTPSGHRYRRDHHGRITHLRAASSFADEPPF